MQSRALVASAIALAIVLAGCSSGNRGSVTPQEYHVHADFKVILGGQALDFNKAQYMSTDTREIDPNVHLHDFNPYVIHFHSQSATMGEFFRSIGMDLNSDCFFDGNKDYCSNGHEKLRFYVNGAPDSGFGAYKPGDLDKVLVYYGPGMPSQSDFGSLTSWACVYSKKCLAPPGVKVEEESCTPTKPCSLNGN